MMIFGFEKSLPSALRLFCHRFFIASVPSMIASEEPMVDVPIALESSSWAGMLKSLAIMETHLFWISAETGYSS